MRFKTLTTIGIIFICILGIGTSLIYVSGPKLLACYFTKNYSTMMGIALAGVGAGLFVIPPLVEELIFTYGWRGAFLIHGALIFNTVSAGAMFQTVVMQKNEKKNELHNSRYSLFDHESVQQEMQQTQFNQIINQHHSKEYEFISDSSKETNPASRHTKWYRSHLRLLIDAPEIVLVLVTAFLTNTAYSAVVIHTANQIVQSGYSEKQGALALSMFGVGSIVGRVFHGFPVDAKIVATSTFYLLSLFLAAAASFVNPILNTYVTSVLCAACVGLTSGIQFPLIYAILRRMAGASQLATATGLEMFADGCGFLAGGYLPGEANS